MVATDCEQFSLELMLIARRTDGKSYTVLVYNDRVRPLKGDHHGSCEAGNTLDARSQSLRGCLGKAICYRLGRSVMHVFWMK